MKEEIFKLKYPEGASEKLKALFNEAIEKIQEKIMIVSENPDSEEAKEIIRQLESKHGCIE